MALQISAYPHMDGKGRRDLFRRLREAAETQTEREARWEEGWSKLDGLLRKSAVGTRSTRGT